MSVRDAKFVDIPAIVALLREAHARSIYADTATFDPVEAKQLLARGIQRHGQQNVGGGLVLVADKDGAIEGVMLGILDTVSACLRELMATDLLFICSERVPPRDPLLLLKQLIAWAEQNPKVIEIRLGAMDAIVSHERTGKMYERLGLTRCGALYRRGVAR